MIWGERVKCRRRTCGTTMEEHENKGPQRHPVVSTKFLHPRVRAGLGLAPFILILFMVSNSVLIGQCIGSSSSGPHEKPDLDLNFEEESSTKSLLSSSTATLNISSTHNHHQHHLNKSVHSITDIAYNNSTNSSQHLPVRSRGRSRTTNGHHYQHQRSRNLVLSGRSSNSVNRLRDGPRRRRNEWEDFVTDFDDDFQDYGKQPATPKTPPFTTTTTTTAIPLETIADELRRRTIRQTDDEDLIESSGDGSGEGPGRPRPVRPGSGVEDDDDEYRRFYRTTLTIGKSWSPALESQTSSTFLVYEEELERTIMRSTTLDVVTVKVIRFEDIRETGYVRTVFDMGVEGREVTQEKIVDEFEEFFEIGTMGPLRVKRDGFSVVDVGAGAPPPPSVCRSTEFTCSTTGQCVSLSALCNGVADCPDASDERGCPSRTTSTTSAPVVTPPITTPKTTTRRPSGGGGPSIPVPTPSVRDDCRADDQVRCSNGAAVICSDQICDGVPDCEDYSDENNCTATDGCPPGQFSCDLGKCKSNSKRCNSIVDCDDGTDEVGCPHGQFTCKSTEFRCSNGECIPLAHYCDKVVHCPDGSDEGLTCPCSPETQFECRETRICIPLSQRCDKIQQCQDGSDEAGCPKPTCTSSEFKCVVSGACIPLTQRCNRREDCPGPGIDRSDEEGCPSTCRPDEFRCSTAGTGSSAIVCLNIARRCDRIPDCPLGDDERGCTVLTTTEAPSQRCGSTQFFCHIDRTCIERVLMCDGYNDCTNGEDEAREVCPSSNTFVCGDGSVIHVNLRCNGRWDCPTDRADEQNCPRCRSDQFRCASGGCIERARVCDSIPDCADFTDESPQTCPGVCAVDDLLCGDGITCISVTRRCDGVFDCPDQLDERDCRPPTPTQPPTCSYNEFRCRDEFRCIAEIARCDGVRHCRDGSDEDECSQCKGSTHRCYNRKCIERSRVCDGRNDCQDSSEGSDEQNCVSTCGATQFACTNGQCIPEQYKCDKISDCADGSDENERICGPRPCSENEFRCRSGGGCVPPAKVCDRVFDCGDGSDEDPSNCPVVCRPDQFRCPTSGTCIDQARKCDRTPDCPNGEDEVGCAPPGRCLPDEFSCRSRDQCVPQSAVCNSVYECNDLSDEQNCQAPPSEGLNLKTYPSDQTIKQAIEGNEVVFQCRDEGPLRAPVRWVRGNGLPLPPGSRDFNGRLEIPNIGMDHSGTYICAATGYTASTPGSRVSVYLRVEAYELPPTRPPSACAVHEATCSNGQCIQKSMVCDGDRDCDDGSDESRCRRDGCEPNEFQCANRKCVPKTWRCDGDDDCGDSSDEQSCTPPPPGSPCRYNEFQCVRGNQCIPKAFHCDKEIDCHVDSSDEFGCSPPTVQVPPPSLITLDVGDVFNISCRVNGIPIPEIVWRLNWGHVPEKCVSTSVNGVGYLLCRDIQIADQGAYSCEALNSLGSIFAIPDCTLVVNTDRSVCPVGYFNDLATDPRDCHACFCFGHTSQCDSVNLYNSFLPPPENNFRIVGVSQDLLEGTIEIQDIRQTLPPRTLTFAASGVGLQATSIGQFGLPADAIVYFALPSSYNGNHIRSFGGYLRYNLRYATAFRNKLNAPDVIISGNGLRLVHMAKQSLAPGTTHEISVRFWPGEWFKRVTGRPGDLVEGREPATREEIIFVLADLQNLLIRAQYEIDSIPDTEVKDIRMDTATTVNTGRGQSVYIEECRCPKGYSGLSCEECAPGYERSAHQLSPWLGNCVPRQTVQPCPQGTYRDVGQCRPCPCPGSGRRFGTSCYVDTDGLPTCTCLTGYTGRNCERCASGYEQEASFPFECRPAGHSCDVDGSLSPRLDPFTGRCECKDFAAGTLCNECKPNTFHLSSANQYGCISCFCMGITNQCSSSNWYRDQESATFFQGPQGFTLVDASQNDVIKEGFTVDRTSGEIGYSRFGQLPIKIYYWQLPFNFLGDKVSSYGGHLNYTIRYIPLPGGQNSPNSAPDVEINGNDIRLLYFRKTPVAPNREETVSVPLLEQHWQRQDGRAVNREHLLMALANLDALLIKATYTTTTRETHLSQVSLDFAVTRNTGQDRAFAVEQCVCPQGYIGLSCEECSYGYTRSLQGLYLGLCEPCSCNGHSEDCDAKTGVCRNCRGYTTGDSCELCEDGYTGDPRYGECRREVGGFCNCDPSGSVRLDCPDGRNCICKGNVEGNTCNRCKPGTFSLQEANALGCLSCYCSGVSTECTSAQLYRLPLETQLHAGPHGFILTDSFRTNTIRDISVDIGANELSYVYPSSPRSDRLYWSLPPKFTGNRVSSYGGKLRATRRYYTRSGSRGTPSEDIDVILVGKNGVSLFYPLSKPISSGQVIELEVSLKETAGWRHIEGSANVASREDLMNVLADVEAILIRATFTEDMESTFIRGVSLDDAVRQFTPNGITLDVEECRCPIGYDGSSCESCSTNYYRDPTDRSRSPLGTCRQCPCRGNTEGCRYESPGRVTCICRPGFSGRNCDTRDRVVVELSPVKVNGAPGRLEEFECSYQSQLALRIEFATSPEWNWLLTTSTIRSFSDKSQHFQFGIEFPAPQWSSKLVAKIPIFPELKKVICRITDRENDIIAEVFSIINSGGAPSPIPDVDLTRPTTGEDIEVFIVGPSNQVVQLAGSVSYRCDARSRSGSPLRITWKKEVGSIPVGRARDDGQGLLVISDIRSNDGGIYICTGTDGYNTYSERVTLTVGGSTPPSFESKPEVTINPRFLNVRSGEAVEFRCTATGYPVPTVSWSGGHLGIFSPRVQVRDGVLTIPSARKGDEAEYHCSARNSLGQASVRTVLYVQEETEEFTNPRPPPFGFVVTITPAQLSAQIGENVQFRCDSSDRQAELQWAKASGTLPFGAVQSPDGVLSLYNVQESNSGIYTCVATGTATSSQAQARLSVSFAGSPPTARIEPERQTIAQGSQIEIRCIITGTPTPVVEWSKAGGNLPATVEKTNEVLIIRNAQVSDRGVYICSVENPQGKSLSSAIVEVDRREPPQIELFPSLHQTVLKDSSALFQCRIIAGIPGPILSWSKADGQLLPSNVEEMQGGVLRFNRVTGDEKGQYVCTAENIAGTTSVTVTLDIQVPPRVSITPAPSPHRVRVGERVRLECHAEGDPLPNVSWKKLRPGELGDVPLVSDTFSSPQTAVYEITRVTRQDEGSYSCSAVNEAGSDEGRFQLLVEESRENEYQSPRGHEEVYYFPIGSRAEMRCLQSFTGGYFDQLQLNWERTDGRPMPSSYNIRDGILYINDVRPEDGGQYACNGVNRQGHVVLTVDTRLEVVGSSPPRIQLQPARQIVRRGDIVNINCLATGTQPITLNWSKVGRSVFPPSVIVNGPQLTFRGIEVTDAGRYACQATNAGGTAESVAEVIVNSNGASPSPRPPRTVTGFIGSSVDLECNARGFSFNWKKVGGVVPLNAQPLGKSLMFDDLALSDSGRYTCESDIDSDYVDLVVETETRRPLFTHEVIAYVESSIDLECNAIGRRLDWSKEGGEVPTRAIPIGTTLTINDVQKSDAGRYTCRSEDGEVDYVDLTVHERSRPPERRAIVGFVGSSIELVCNARGRRLDWRKEGGDVPLTAFPLGTSLTLENLQIKDSGLYVCESETRDADYIDLTVEDPNRSRRFVGFLGSSIDLECHARGRRVSWRKDGGPVQQTAVPLGSTLTLLNLQSTDAGRYTCTTEEDTDYVEVVVEERRIERRTVECKAHEFKCATGNQCVPLEDWCNGETDCLDGSDEKMCLLAPVVSRKKRQRRGVQTIRVKITSNKDLLRIGEDAEIRCDVTGDVNARVRWTKVRGDMAANVQAMGNLLKVTGVTLENGGVYRCLAMTSGGVYEDDYALTIQANPDVPLNSENIETKTAPFGSTATMDCKTDLDPPIAYTWAKQNGNIPSSAVIQGPLLTIPDLAPEDAGTYVCTATSRNVNSVDIPTMLVVTGVVPHFTQTPASYMTLPTLPDSYLTFDLEISFKPEDKDGLILYNSQRKDGTGDFVSFGLVNGVPEFRFDVGSGPAVIKADRPITTNEWHTAKLSRDRRGGTMMVDSDGPYQGNIRGKFEGLDLIEPLYIGGLQNFGQIHKLAGQRKGFVGCVSKLVIGGKKQQLLRDSQTSRGISTCNTCEVNLCRNGGICQEGLTDRGYSCICQPGYSGENCGVAGQACYPGACGTGKCVNVLGGFDCYCNFGKTGVFCERDVVIYEPSFSGDSYLSYPTPKALKKFKMGLKVKPETTADGLLIYSSQTDNGHGDFTSLSIRDRHLEFQFDTGSGPAVIRSKREVKPGEWIDISMERDAQDGELIVGGSDVTKGKSPGTTRGLNLNTPLFLGGYDKSRIQLNPNVRVDKGFRGCVSELAVSGMEIQIVESVLEGANVDNCGSNTNDICSKNPCRNQGVCLSNNTKEYFCDCPPGFLGDRCEIVDSCTPSPCLNNAICHIMDDTYKCSCVGGFHGRNCEDKLEFSESVAFRGEGYLELGNVLLPHTRPEEEEVIELEISTKRQHGLLLFHGQTPTETLVGDDFLAVGLVDGKVEFSYDLGSGPSSIVSSTRVDDGDRHKITVKRTATEGSLQIDDEEPELGTSQGDTQTLNTRGNIYLGGAPNPRGMTDGKYSDGFVGCVHSLQIQGSKPINLKENAVSTFNSGPCSSEEQQSRRSTLGSSNVEYREEEIRHRKNITILDYEEEYEYEEIIGENIVA